MARVGPNGGRTIANLPCAVGGALWEEDAANAALIAQAPALLEAARACVVDHDAEPGRCATPEFLAAMRDAIAKELRDLQKAEGS